MIKDEETFVDEIEKIFKNNNFQTFREVVPDQCMDWEKPYRVDLIVYRSDFGFIGIEAKYLNTLGQGQVIAEAFEQIKKYKDLTYFKGNLVTRWCIAPRFEGEGSHVAMEFVQRFLNYYNISFLSLSEYKNNSSFDRISIDRNTKNSEFFRRNNESVF